MTRDSRWWWLAILGAWCGSLAAHPDLVEQLMEGDRSAWVSALCQLVAITSAFLKASPLKLSARGRQKYLDNYIRLRPLDADD